MINNQPTVDLMRIKTVCTTVHRALLAIAKAVDRKGQELICEDEEGLLALL